MDEVEREIEMQGYEVWRDHAWGREKVKEVETEEQAFAAVPDQGRRSTCWFVRSEAGAWCITPKGERVWQPAHKE